MHECSYGVLQVLVLFTVSFVLIFILFCVLLAIVYSLGNQNLVVLLAWTMYSCVQHELTDVEGAPRIHGGTYMRKIAFVNIGNGV